MLTKWKTGGYKQMIERVECTRETAKAVWVMEVTPAIFGSKKPAVEVRRMKQSEYENYHDTWEAARTFLLGCAVDGLDKAKVTMQNAERTYMDAKNLTKPEDA